MQNFGNPANVNLDGEIRRVHAGVANTDIEDNKQVVLTVYRPNEHPQRDTITKQQANNLQRWFTNKGWNVRPGIHPGTHWVARPNNTVN